MEKQVVAIYYGTKGFMDDVPVKDIKRFEREVLEFIDVKYKSIFESIKKDKDISKETDELLQKAGKEFLAVFK